MSPRFAYGFSSYALTFIILLCSMTSPSFGSDDYSMRCRVNVNELHGGKKTTADSTTGGFFVVR